MDNDSIKFNSFDPNAITKMVFLNNYRNLDNFGYRMLTGSNPGNPDVKVGQQLVFDVDNTDISNIKIKHQANGGIIKQLDLNGERVADSGDDLNLPQGSTKNYISYVSHSGVIGLPGDDVIVDFNDKRYLSSAVRDTDGIDQKGNGPTAYLTVSVEGNTITIEINDTN